MFAFYGVFTFRIGSGASTDFLNGLVKAGCSSLNLSKKMRECNLSKNLKYLSIA